MKVLALSVTPQEKNVKHKARGCESARQRFPTEQCEGGHKFEMCNCIFLSLITFPTDKKLPQDNSYKTKVNQ